MNINIGLERLRDIRELNGKKEVTIDQQFINDVLSGKAIRPDQYPLQPSYNRLSSMEVTIAGMERGKPIVHIGTGWPGTAIGMYTQFGIPVTCVEKDPELDSNILNNPWLSIVGDSNALLQPADLLRSFVFRVHAMAELKRGSDRILIAAQERLQQPLQLVA